MATQSDLLNAFREHMITAEIVRRPAAGVQGTRPPMFIEPEDGPLAPGDLKKPEENDALLVVSIFWGGGIPADANDGYRLRGTIDVRLRSRGTPGLQRAMSVAARIRAEMFEPGAESPGIARQGWSMAGVPMIRTGEWAPLGRIGSSRDAGYDHVWKAYVEAYA